MRALFSPQKNKNRSVRLHHKLNFMKEGTVKFFNSQKGFGFIVSESGEEIFVHVSGLIDEIRDNDKVSYEEEEGKKGLNAVRVRVL